MAPIDPDDVLVVVPARSGSKRLPGKNLMKIGSRSLLERAADFLREEGYLHRAILSTDDQRIAEAGEEAGFNVPYLRPTELASDTASSISVVRHAVEWSRAKKREPEIVVLIQVTTPFRRHGLLTDSLHLLAMRPELNAVVAMRQIHVTMSYVFKGAADSTVRPYVDAPERGWIPTGALYACRSRVAMQENSLYCYPLARMETPGLYAIDIDDQLDLDFAALAWERDPQRRANPGGV